MAAKKPAKKSARKRAQKSAQKTGKGKKPSGRPTPKKTKGVTRRRGGGKQKGDGDSRNIPKGSKGLTNAEKSLRDSLILQRRAQRWTWEQIAEEVGLSVSACKRAAKAKRETMLQILDMDPIEVVKKIIEGFEASIGDLEVMATEYAQHHPSAAVGAKKGADEARRNLITLLQSIGFLPNELGTIRWIVEVRQIVELLTTSVTRFETRISDLDLEPKVRKQLEDASGELRKALHEAAAAPE
jgi:hypothetical protein